MSYTKNMVKYSDREKLYSKLIPNKTMIRLTDGKHKGKRGVLTRKGDLKNNDYDRWRTKTYYNYFNVTVLVDNKKIVTSCNHIKVAH